MMQGNLTELLMLLRNGMVSPERSGEYWHEDEQKKLETLFAQGTGISEIALHLQRSEWAIIQQLMTRRCLTPAHAIRVRAHKPPKCLCEKCELTACPWRNSKEGWDAGQS